MNTWNKTMLAAAVAAGVMTIGGAAQAAPTTIISYQFSQSGAQIASTDTAGVGSATHWNVNIKGGGVPTSGNLNVLSGSSSSSLVDSTGASTTLTGSYSSSLGSSYVYLYGSNSTPNNKIFSALIGATQPNTQNGTLSLANIPYASYDLIVYLQDNNDSRNDGHISISLAGGPTYTGLTFNSLDSSASPVVFTQITGSNGSGNYVKFADLTGSTQDFTFNNSAFTYGAGVSGFQIVEVPEPASLALLGLGGALLLRRRRQSV